MITVHDLIAFLFPNYHEAKATILEKLFLGRALKKAHRVLVPSENTKKDLVKLFGVKEEKIAVAPLGVSIQNHPEPRSGEGSYILTVGTLAPRKNIEMLVDVFIDSRFYENDKLVIVGGRAWQSKKLLQKILNHPDRIIYKEHTTREELTALYRHAKIFVYPSLYEGFGLPPLEAMAEGCPVICSNAASLPEVCGDAAIFFDPKNPEELKQTLQKALSDEKLRAELSKKSLKQAKKFSWRHTAKLTLSVIA